MIWWAIVFWQPMASRVTMQFFNDSVSSSAGIAVISFDLPSTSRWPRARPCSLAQGRRMKSASQKSEHVIIVPGGLLATRPHADPGCSVPPHEAEGDLAQDGQVASCRAIPDAAVTLAEGDIEDPMDPIFNRPVPADRLDQRRWVITAA